MLQQLSYYWRHWFLQTLSEKKQPLVVGNSAFTVSDHQKLFPLPMIFVLFFIVVFLFCFVLFYFFVYVCMCVLMVNKI